MRIVNRAPAAGFDVTKSCTSSCIREYPCAWGGSRARRAALTNLPLHKMTSDRRIIEGTVASVMPWNFMVAFISKRFHTTKVTIFVRKASGRRATTRSPLMTFFSKVFAKWLVCVWSLLPSHHHLWTGMVKKQHDNSAISHSHLAGERVCLRPQLVFSVEDLQVNETVHVTEHVRDEGSVETLTDATRTQCHRRHARCSSRAGLSTQQRADTPRPVHGRRTSCAGTL